ncbi:UDP-N-acetylmuramoyl-L-alanyl-D-glutamate--2,6-diaminopimelate ligase [Arthrobacter sp. AL08]|uniref:UDP-N-acetylmuramoyl-L-alanyl-D-glutamate--2, 6-diaminopimelate ligase n=1 Tax=unclassified Arthrobacter TaxID=235627 RepID=UPI001CFFB541|nr:MULTISPECIES: UDP-N-acetylmuramoyl-L-alanyl-D-glutamate--2,6-diaminopimelate ligase [unclassified Arthrobacter]MCB5281657.1 UDP-N-acetylmuramoyl-L-alanyl-D-glutamate--2,6-diaminopimelate ligase [Arthrobacter sp. ES1]MDI3241682.1 UDP-N-acetylmuramoyl-L-alanyl-D-glutamate--2,6-diaminopimelate ligase [Arthrobacter sp. AL05]MDI3277692.1 UDP-N-acetylmuramoyl-L-alanyl-D-glutamate--2,6-diaminopimelate ligase [Arthrobacter sp. AL08]WGZ80557.1 UDP-N-acetylmuramoyl-L-alanyl-D-glutamate--2,6-diaminopim
MSDQFAPGASAAPSGPGSTRGFRPTAVAAVPLAAIGEAIGVDVPGASGAVPVTGISLNSRTVQPGDLYVALPGASRHGAGFVAQAVEGGAAAILTDDAGARLLAFSHDIAVPVLLAQEPRSLVGGLSALIYRSRPDDAIAPALYGVTGTNGKTTTTYFLNALLQGLGQKTGLIGTIEILAGGAPIPSLLTTPESTDVHALLALMRERGLDAASMEVSSHAVAFHRVDGVVFDVAGFTNLTQDHLDLHGSMDEYFQTKARLFTAGRARSAVVTVDDAWGVKLAATAGIPVTTLATQADSAAAPIRAEADWTVHNQAPRGLGTAFTLQHRDGTQLRVHTGLPGSFNVANAALATVMVLAGGHGASAVQAALDAAEPFTVAVPGRMQLVSTAPAAVVDFAHNPDALARALEAVRSPQPGSRVIVVFGATGQRDQSKRPAMGAIAARLADTVIVSDDDPHDEDAAAIRADVMAGALDAKKHEGLGCSIIEVFPRAAAIRKAVELAGPADTILVAGRGHEIWQEVKGVNLALDDRVELRSALTARGFTVLEDQRIES